jgi:hypothetical protein
MLFFALKKYKLEWQSLAHSSQNNFLIIFACLPCCRPLHDRAHQELTPSAIDPS